MSFISETLRQKIRTRADNRCEYCLSHQDYMMGTEIIGLTPCGRATISALKLNSNLAVTVRKNWVTAGWHPPN